MKTRYLLLFALFSTTARAADALMVSDLRLTAAIGSLNDYGADYEYTAGPNSFFRSGSASSSEAPDGLRVYRLGYTGGALTESGGLIFGVAIQRLNASADVAGTSFDARATGLQGKLGYGVRMGDTVHFEICPFVGFGAVDVEDLDVTRNIEADRARGDGNYYQIGLEAGIYAAVTRHFVLGFFVSADLTRADWDTDFSLTGGSYSADADWSTLLLGAAIGLRF